MTNGFTVVSPPAVYEWIKGDEEIAFLDIQEIGQHGLAHPLVASNLPFSRLEAEISHRVPRKDTRIVMTDSGDNISEIAAQRLSELGYQNINVLNGGAPAWAAAGFSLFDGTNVPSKAFAEVLEVQLGTPHISAQDLAKLQAENANFVLLDNRTPEEFGNFHVPGAESAPGIELVARAQDYIPDPDTLVVVSCAGRTRSIIGAQGLINFGIPNKVVSLEGGTQGWRLAGLKLEHTPATPVRPISEEARAVAIERAHALRRQYGIREISAQDVDVALSDSSSTTYLFDVRTLEDYLAGHHPAARWVPGGQLVQTLDQWASVLNAKVILTDDDGIRASVTAHWLIQLGWDVEVATLSPDQLNATEALPFVDEENLSAITPISPGEARDWLGASGRIVHAGSSTDYLAGHPSGANWITRAQLGEHAETLIGAERVLIIGDGDLVTARLVAGDLQRIGVAVRLLTGGTNDWEQAGGTVIRDAQILTEKQRPDVLFWLSRRHQDDFKGMRAYLDWELELPDRIAKDGTARFRITEPVGTL